MSDPSWIYYRRWLVKQIRKHNYNSFIELGVLKGDTIKYLYDNITDLKLTGVDHWKTKPHVWERLCESDVGKDSRVRLIKENTKTAHRHIPNNSTDIIFIDAGHRYHDVVEDITNWMPKLKREGTLCGHDIFMDPVRSAVLDTIGEVDMLPFPENIWVKKYD